MLGWALGLWQLSLGVVMCLVPSQCWWGCVCVCVCCLASASMPEVLIKSRVILFCRNRAL